MTLLSPPIWLNFIPPHEIHFVGEEHICKKDTLSSRHFRVLLTLRFQGNLPHLLKFTLWGPCTVRFAADVAITRWESQLDFSDGGF